MVKEYTPNPEWTPRDLKAIELNDLYYKIKKGFIDKKPLEVISGVREYEDLKEDSIVKEYPMLTNNESEIIRLIKAHELNLVGSKLVLN
jgi:hypothetical protein